MELNKHNFFAGLARPSIIFGVPTGYFGFLLCFVLVGFIGSSNFLVVLFAIPFWFVGYLICIKDPSLMGVWWVKISVLPITLRNTKFWKARSYQP